MVAEPRVQWEKLVFCSGIVVVTYYCVHLQVTPSVSGDIVNHGDNRGYFESCDENGICQPPNKNGWTLRSRLAHNGYLLLMLLCSLLPSTLVPDNSWQLRKSNNGILYSLLIPYILLAISIAHNVPMSSDVYCQLILSESCLVIAIAVGYVVSKTAISCFSWGFAIVFMASGSIIFLDVHIDITTKIYLHMLTVLFQLIIANIFSVFPKTFSCGEGVIVTQALVAFVLQAGLVIIKSLNHQQIFLHTDLLDKTTPYSFLSIVGLSCLVLLVLIGSISSEVRSRAMVFLLALISCAILALLGSLYRGYLFVLLTDLLEHQTMMFLIPYWLALTLLSVTVVVIAQQGYLIVTPTARKYFHAFATLVFLPGIIQAAPLTKLASAAALAVFLLLEFIRFMRITSFSEVLHMALQGFLDGQDSGALVLTHIYLLTGCSAALWFAPSSDLKVVHISLFSGVVSLGVGDSFASVVGRSIGRHHLPGTRKTVEGTIAAALSMMACLLVLRYFVVAKSLDIGMVVVVSCLVAVMEAFSSQVDNLILPLYMYALLIPVTR